MIPDKNTTGSLATSSQTIVSFHIWVITVHFSGTNVISSRTLFISPVMFFDCLFHHDLSVFFILQTIFLIFSGSSSICYLKKDERKREIRIQIYMITSSAANKFRPNYFHCQNDDNSRCSSNRTDSSRS